MAAGSKENAPEQDNLCEIGARNGKKDPSGMIPLILPPIMLKSSRKG